MMTILWEFPLLYIFGPALLFGTVILRVQRNKRKKLHLSKFSEAVEHFKMTSIVFGALVVVLWLLLPSTPSLSTFGYPDSIADIDTSEKTLHLLQSYNRAIVRTTESFHWFLFLFVWWFLTSLFGAADAVKERAGETFA
ncbi:hypothetical protein V9K67_04545 [Paraflavisolibacter sp. H34]|uniref:hypothetical protein n=1 Tax=Huijunlia imazamoxiresistens TaxID=3127457 RepID=UPI003016BF61